MTFHSLETGNFKLDGGAMFGVVPKKIWNKTNPADQDNLIAIAARCLLIENGNRLTLIDSGMGTKQSNKFFSYYKPFGNNNLQDALQKAGFSKDDVTDVFFTHLHFDHCGGAVDWNDDRTGYKTTFKNATYWSNADHWKWATTPNKREKASFLKENIEPIETSGQLKFLPSTKKSFLATTPLDFSVHYMNGHTDKQMLPHLKHNGKTIVFMADLLPTVGHIPLPYIMGYDTRPLKTLEEKEKFLNQAATNNWYLLLEHDIKHEIITVQHTEKGVRLNEVFSFNDIFN